MGLNCGAAIVKYILFAFNIIFVISGGAVLGLGIWIQVDSRSFLDFSSRVDPSGASVVIQGQLAENMENVHIAGIVLSSIGGAIFLIGFLGCCGACKEWRLLLVGYAVFLILIMAAEMGFGIYVGVHKDDVFTSIATELKDTLINKYEFVNNLQDGGEQIKPINGTNPLQYPAETNAMNMIQVTLSCCGLRNYTDFLTSPYGQEVMPFQAPVFCCRLRNINSLIVEDRICLANRTDMNSNQNMGCVTKIEDFIEYNAPIIIGVAVGVGLIELVGVFFAFCLCCSIGDKKEKRERKLLKLKRFS